MGKYATLAQECYLKLKLAGYTEDEIAEALDMSRPTLMLCRHYPSKFKIYELEEMLELVAGIKIIKPPTPNVN